MQEIINVAAIGIGGHGGTNINAVAALGHNIVALCDVDAKYAAKKFAQYPKAKKFVDYQVMFAKMHKKIDAVLIGTPDHTHAVIAMEAMRRGKHVYCEKPLAHSVHDVRALMAAARKYGVVTQVGNQGHASDNIRKVCEWVWAGAIGEIHTIHAGCGEFKEVYDQIPNLKKKDLAYEVPETLDYDKWIGPAPFLPYTPLWVPWNWRGWMPFGTGTIGDWVCHVLDPAYWALDLGAPTSIQAEVTGYNPKKHALCYPKATRITFEFPANAKRGPVTLIWHDGNRPIPTPEGFPEDDKVPRTGAILFGDKGMIVHGSHGGGGCRILPETQRALYTEDNAPPQTIPRGKGHHWDWLEAIRMGREAGSNFDYGGRLSQVALLAVIAIRFPGVTLAWNDAEGRFTNHDTANALLDPPHREGWGLTGDEE